MELKVSSERKAYYDELFKNNKPVENSNGIETYPVPYKSNEEYSKLPVYEIEIGEDFKTGLRFNLHNSRILPYKLKKEKEIGKELDPDSESTQKLLEGWLKKNASYSKHATRDLKKELKATGQLDPAIISCDGVIWNANRRIALRKELFTDDWNPKWKRVKVVRLPELNLKQLNQLEHRLQMSKSFKEDYGSITLRLRCRQAIKEDKWSYGELNNSFRDHYTKKVIEGFIKEIDLIDEYLDRTGHPSDYPLIESKGEGKGVEIFTSLNKHLDWEEKNKSEDYEIEKIKTIFFSIISNPKTTYADTRSLAKQLQNIQTRELYFENSPICRNYHNYVKPDSEGNEQTFSLEISKQEQENLIKTQGVLDAIKDSPIDILNKILSQLDTIKEEIIEKEDKEFFDKLGDLEKKINNFKKLSE